MVNRYFVQYLLNVGVLSSEEVQALLPRIAQAKPQLPLLALMKGFVTSSQLNELSGLDENTFAEEAKDKKILTALQIENLQSIVPERDVCFSQLLLDDGKLDYKGVEDHLAAYAKAEAEYEYETKKIDAKDKKYDNELSKLETEREALKTEYDSVKKVISDNIERTFGIFS